jgi:hypothetical protein
MTIVREQDTIRSLVGAFVFISRGLHKSKVHKEFHAAKGYAFRGVVGGLFTDIGMFFEVYVLKRVVCKGGGSA